MEAQVEPNVSESLNHEEEEAYLYGFEQEAMTPEEIYTIGSIDVSSCLDLPNTGEEGQNEEEKYGDALKFQPYEEQQHPIPTIHVEDGSVFIPYQLQQHQQQHQQHQQQQQQHQPLQLQPEPFFSDQLQPSLPLPQEYQTKGYDKIRVHRDQMVCKFFGTPTGCNKGSSCKFSHALRACRFFGTQKGCQKGMICRFAHVPPTFGNNGSSSSNNGSNGGGGSAPYPSRELKKCPNPQCSNLCYGKQCKSCHMKMLNSMFG